MQVSAWRLARWGHAQPGTPPPRRPPEPHPVAGCACQCCPVTGDEVKSVGAALIPSEGWKGPRGGSGEQGAEGQALGGW